MLRSSFLLKSCLQKTYDDSKCNTGLHKWQDFLLIPVCIPTCYSTNIRFVYVFVILIQKNMFEQKKGYVYYKAHFPKVCSF